MITGLILTALASVAGLMIGLLPDSQGEPEAAGAVVQGIATFMGYAASLGAWIPWGVVAPAFAVIGAGLVVATAVKLVRIVASFVTLGGGSAA